MRNLISLGIILAVVLISASAVSAAVCENDDQIIMRLSSTNNAHGALWDQTYETKICYDKFWDAFSGATHPHDYSPGDTLLNLYSPTNSHAATSASLDYDYPVYHKGLRNCTVWQGETCTKSNKKAIVYLSALSNAHLSTTYSDGFYSICCSNWIETPSPTPAPVNCIEYRSESECNSDQGVAAQIGCPSGKYCFCEWNPDTHQCLQVYGIETGSSDGGCAVQKCVFTPIDYESAVCKENNYKTIGVDAKIVVSPGCTAIEDLTCIPHVSESPCGLVGLDLPFFGAWQFGASVIGIFLVYLVLRKIK